MSVNDNIRLIREAKGLTQEQVAEKLGICVNAYGNIERGDNDPKLSKLQKIAKILEIKLSELIGLSEKENFTINFANYQNKKSAKNKIHISSAASELDKLQLQLEFKNKELAMKDQEIAHLKEIIALLKHPSENGIS